MENPILSIEVKHPPSSNTSKMINILKNDLTVQKLKDEIKKKFRLSQIPTTIYGVLNDRFVEIEEILDIQTVMNKNSYFVIEAPAQQQVTSQQENEQLKEEIQTLKGQVQQLQNKVYRQRTKKDTKARKDYFDEIGLYINNKPKIESFHITTPINSEILELLESQLKSLLPIERPTKKAKENKPTSSKKTQTTTQKKK